MYITTLEILKSDNICVLELMKYYSLIPGSASNLVIIWLHMKLHPLSNPYIIRTLVRLFHRCFRNQDRLANIIRILKFLALGKQENCQFIAQSPTCTWHVLTDESDFQCGFSHSWRKQDPSFPGSEDAWPFLVGPTVRPYPRHSPGPLSELLKPQVPMHRDLLTLRSQDRFHKKILNFSQFCLIFTSDSSSLTLPFVSLKNQICHSEQPV